MASPPKYVYIFIAILTPAPVVKCITPITCIFYLSFVIARRNTNTDSERQCSLGQRYNLHLSVELCGGGCVVDKLTKVKKKHTDEDHINYFLWNFHVEGLKVTALCRPQSTIGKGLYYLFTMTFDLMEHVHENIEIQILPGYLGQQGM